MSVDELRRKAQKLEKRIYRRNLREYAAAIFVIAVFAWKTAVSTVAFERIGSSLVVACTLYVVYHLHRKGSPGTARPDTAFAPLLDFYRTELERQRDLLRSIWSWYLGPLAFPMFVLMLGTAMTKPSARPSVLLSLAPLVALVLLVWKLNQRVARKLQREIDALQKDAQT